MLCSSFSHLCWEAGTHTMHYFLHSFLTLSQDYQQQHHAHKRTKVMFRSPFPKTAIAWKFCSPFPFLFQRPPLNSTSLKVSTYNWHIGQREVLWFPPNRNWKPGFEGWFIEAWEGHSRCCWLKLRRYKRSKWGKKKGFWSHTFKHAVFTPSMCENRVTAHLQRNYWCW